jgi:hypothetical protein
MLRLEDLSIQLLENYSQSILQPNNQSTQEQESCFLVNLTLSAEDRSFNLQTRFLTMQDMTLKLVALLTLPLGRNIPSTKLPRFLSTPKLESHFLESTIPQDSLPINPITDEKEYPKFDPNTGMPVDPSSGNPYPLTNSGQPYDPISNTPLPGTFDPRTGRPINPLTMEVIPDKFDFKTGKPLNPVTGKPFPLNKNGEPVNEERGGKKVPAPCKFDPKTGAPVDPKTNKPITYQTSSGTQRRKTRSKLSQ